MLVPQGSLDAVTGPERAVQRAEAMGALGADARLLVSGHCPHDETPDLVAEAISGWWPAAVERAAELSR